MTFGSFTLKLALLFSFIAFVAAVRWARGRAASERTFRLAYHGLTASLLAAAAALLAAIFTHDFRFEYVTGYTSRDLPPLYLLSALWAGQSGTLLLWALLGAVVGYGLLGRRGRVRLDPPQGAGGAGRATAIACYLPSIGFLQLLMLDPAGDPFRLAAAVPPDGRGLNPLLQDPWMASHPPLVFLGYAAMAVPAALALAALLRRRGEGWQGPALHASLIAFVSLGAGIVLGGFWAYKVLGWGGYWGWDPVENASLVPWLIAAALIHGLLVERGTGALPRTNLALALSGYVLVLYATLLTRSGVLAEYSVHSFPAGGIYRMLVAILVFVGAVSAVALLRRRGGASGIETTLTLPFVLASALLVLVVSAALVLVGTSWPILSSVAGKGAAVTAGFYNLVNLPLWTILLGLLAVAPFLSWTPRSWRLAGPRLLAVLIVAVAATAGALALGGRGAASLLVFFVASGALAANLIRLAEQARRRWLGTGAAIAHAGLALMFLGIVGSSSWGVSEPVRLPLDHPVEALGRTLTFRGHVPDSEPESRWRIVVQAPGAAESAVDVTMFELETGGQPSTFRRPAILRAPGGDLYLAPLALSEPPGTLTLTRGEPVRLGEARLTLLGFEASEGSGHGMSASARVRVVRGRDNRDLALPLSVSGGQILSRPVVVDLLEGRSLSLRRMSVEEGRVDVEVEYPPSAAGPALDVEASTKPLIGLLWVGTILLGTGCGLAIVRRVVDERQRLRTTLEESRRARRPRRRKAAA